MDVKILVNEYELIPRTNTEWWLDVKWEIQNFTENTCYVLTKGFLSISMKDSLVIDHTTDSGSYMVDSQIDPIVKFETLKGKESLILEYRYPLPHISALNSKEVRAVGKFAVNQIAPDSAWTMDSHWDLIKKWENVIFSNSFWIKE